MDESGHHPWHEFIGNRSVLTSPARFASTVRHLASRGTFTLCMLSHPRIVKVGNRCFARGPIEETDVLWSAAGSCWEFTEQLGIDQAAEDLPPDTSESDRARFAALFYGYQAAYDRYAGALAPWHRTLVRSVRRTMSAHFSMCVVPACRGHLWPWLLQDLSQALSMLFLDLVLGDDDTASAPVLDYTIDPAPRRIAVDIIQGERPARVNARVRAELKAAAARVTGGVPRKKLESGEYSRYAVW